jgi:hypothetical protein
MRIARCPFCGGDASERHHRDRCDGRQGVLEFALVGAPEPSGGHEPLPPWTGLESETRATSFAAAVAVVPDVQTLREEVYQYMWRAGPEGRTDEENQIGLKMTGNTERPRRRELQDAGRIFSTSRTRLTSSGRRAVVWVAKREWV